MLDRDSLDSTVVSGNGNSQRDLGCGPADISIRFAQAHPDCEVDGLDGAPKMLAQGKLAIQKAQLQDRIHLLEGLLPGANLPRDNYDVIISNSLLH